MLTGALLLGNAPTLIRKLIPGARPEAFVLAEVERIMHAQMSVRVQLIL